METHRRNDPFTLDWPYVIGILCGICLGLNACTKPPMISSTPVPSVEMEMPPLDSSQPDSSGEVETQLLETVKTAENLGEGNPLLMSSLYSLASFYEQQGEFDKAEEQYKRALSIKEKVSGPNHPDVAIILNKYAALLRHAHRDEEADHFSRRASEITAKQPPTHPSL
jgi:tetratricopeptide (TPR) repeat protein